MLKINPPEKWIETGLFMAAVVSAVAIVSILLLLIYFCLPLFTGNGLSRVFSWRWQPIDGQFGILPMCAGSLALSILALGIAFPPAIGICTLVHVLSRGVFARIVLILTHFMTGIPTVIYGFVSVFVLVPRIRSLSETGTGFSLLTAALTLAILILPTIVLVCYTRLEQLDPILRLASTAMGFTPIQQMRHVLMPAATKGVAAATILGLGRAMGDTLISLMLAGNAAQFPGSLFTSFRSLTAHIGLVVATDSQSLAYQSVFAAGLVLFLLVAALNLLIRKTDNRITANAFLRVQETRHEQNF
ncbi:MAG: PstC family ABC transporter permease [Desulfatirhabdiaceae bacterium]